MQPQAEGLHKCLQRPHDTGTISPEICNLTPSQPLEAKLRRDLTLVLVCEDIGN